MMICNCDDLGCVAIDAAAAAAAAVGIDAAAAVPVVVIVPIEDWADYDYGSVVSEVGLGHEGRCFSRFFSSFFSFLVVYNSSKTFHYA